ncbi:MAG: hypothetical protein ABI658_31315, partial [Acidimicrobiales bacterium]
GVEHARARLLALRETNAVVAVSIGERPYALSEVRAALDGVELATISDDRRAATAIGKCAALDRWLRRSEIVRTATSLLDRVRSLHRESAVAS